MLKQRMILLLITTLLLLSGWGFLEYLIDYQVQNVYKSISSYPVILYSYDMDLLHRMQHGTHRDQGTFEIPEFLQKSRIPHP